jgi:mycothiol system anti-sigma-R factor
MTCRDAIDAIADFLDQTLPRDAGEYLERHLRDCAPCQAYLNTYRKTRALVRREGRVDMPEELRARLRRFLLDQLGAPPA